MVRYSMETQEKKMAPRKVTSKTFLAGTMFAIGFATCVSAQDNPIESQASHPSAIEIADAYLEAYQAYDLDRLNEFYAPDAAFIDPTSLDMSNPFNWTGKDEIVGHLRQYLENVSSATFYYDIQRKYESSGRVVYNAVGSFTVKTPQMEISGSAPIVTIITVNDGKVIEHRDYVDYHTLKLNTVQKTLAQ